MRGVLPCLFLLALTACGQRAPAPAAVEVTGYRPARVAWLRAAGWRTAFGGRSVAPAVLRMGPVTREHFVAITAPTFEAAARVALDPSEPVLVVWGRRSPRAWPLVYLLQRELVLDRVEDVPVAVTFCSLCGSARVWDRRLEGKTLDLAVSGLLLGANSLLYDRGSESLWRQLDGQAVAGVHSGRRLRSLRAFTISFGALRKAHPEARVMCPPDAAPLPPITQITADEVVEGVPPAWLSTTCPQPLAMRLSHAAGSDAIVTLRDPATAPVHRDANGALGPAVGSSAAFRAEVEGRMLHFHPAPGGAVDRETGSRWNALGEAVEGPLRGTRLEPVEQVLAFRFALP